MLFLALGVALANEPLVCTVDVGAEDLHRPLSELVEGCPQDSDAVLLEVDTELASPGDARNVPRYVVRSDGVIYDLLASEGELPPQIWAVPMVDALTGEVLWALGDEGMRPRKRSISIGALIR